MRNVENYITEFEKELSEANRNLSQLPSQIHSPDARNIYDIAVDAYGDAQKILEELETDFLRRKIPSLREEQYLEARLGMQDGLSSIHASLLELKKSLDLALPKKIGVPA